VRIFNQAHGFYNFSPTFYYDFYGQNGHKLASEIIATRNAGLDVHTQVLHPVARQKDIPVETGVASIIQKMNTEPPIFPVQSKYLATPNLKAN